MNVRKGIVTIVDNGFNDKRYIFWERDTEE